jgi:hypothetical protein
MSANLISSAPVAVVELLDFVRKVRAYLDAETAAVSVTADNGTVYDRAGCDRLERLILDRAEREGWVA